MNALDSDVPKATEAAFATGSHLAAAAGRHLQVEPEMASAHRLLLASEAITDKKEQKSQTQLNKHGIQIQKDLFNKREMVCLHGWGLGFVPCCSHSSSLPQARYYSPRERIHHDSPIANHLQSAASD